MKHLLIIVTLFIVSLCTMPATAQKQGKGSEQRVVHMVQILALDDATSARFTPLYSKYREEMRATRQKYKRVKPAKKKGGDTTPLTDEQVRKNIETSFALSQSIIDIRKKYYKEFLKILSPRQIERLYDLEKKDGEKLSEMAKKHKKKK